MRPKQHDNVGGATAKGFDAIRLSGCRVSNGGEPQKRKKSLRSKGRFWRRPSQRVAACKTPACAHALVAANAKGKSTVVSAADSTTCLRKNRPSSSRFNNSTQLFVTRGGLGGVREAAGHSPVAVLLAAN